MAREWQDKMRYRVAIPSGGAATSRYSKVISPYIFSGIECGNMGGIDLLRTANPIEITW
jgi:hypothetical protein